MGQQDLILKTWGDPPLLNYREVHGEESHGGHGSFGVRIFATVTHELSKEERIAIYRATDIISKAIRTEDMRLDTEQQRLKKEERAALLRCFILPFQVEELPNGYCSDWCCTQKPWYRVLTTIGWITIGWRKHVINIEWSETTNKKSGEELFPNYEPTKGDRYVHAYGYEKAAQLLAVIVQ